MDNTTEELFQLRVTDSIIASFRKLLPVAKWVYGLSICLCLGLGFLAIDRWRRTPESGDVSWKHVLETKVFPSLEMGLIIVVFIGTFFYYQFFRLSNRAIRFKDQQLLERAFRQLYISLFLFLLQIILTAPVMLYAIFYLIRGFTNIG